MRKFIIPSLVLLLALSPLATLGQEDSLVPDYRNESDAGDFIEDYCPFYILPPEEEGDTVACGYLIVPENRNDSRSPNIQLAVMIIYATGRNPSDAPIIYLEGGPGGSAISAYEYWYESSLREDYDIILIDQRGTGFSLPSLNCYEADEEDDYVGDCAERLSDEDINLAAYNSNENAHDIADLIAALDLDAVNLYGTSYGSRLALTIMREAPEKLRSVILEAVYPPHVNAYDEQGINWWNALQALFAACESDRNCNNDYPDLENVFLDTLESLDDNPMEVEDYETGDYYDLDGYGFLDEIFNFMYDSEMIPYLPALIYAASEGDADAYMEIVPDYPEEADYSDEYYEALDDALMDYLEFEDYDEMYDYLDSLDDDEYYYIEDAILGYIDDDSEGMFTSVECVEEIPFNSMDSFEDVSGDIPVAIIDYFEESLEQSFDDCSLWDVDQAGRIENELVRSIIPVLIVSGQFDPITPPIWGDAAAEGLPNSYHFTYPNMGHGAIDSDSCPTAMALEFLANPNREPDDSCISRMDTSFE